MEKLKKLFKDHRNPQPSNFRTADAALGLKELWCGEAPIVDIVAIHGLDGHRETSWTGKQEKLWLRDFLPQKIPYSRILTYGYDANTHGQSQLSEQTIEDHGETLISKLALFRRGSNTMERAIIFIAHSLGGIVLKCALNYSHYTGSKSNLDHRSISLSTSGVIFLGTPHLGAHIAELASTLLKLRGFVQKVNNKVLNDLKPDSVILQRHLHQYISISESFDTKLFYEIYATNSSAVIEGLKGEVISLSKNHIEMAKFEDADDDDFKTVAEHLRHMSHEAYAKVAQRWAEYKKSPMYQHSKPIMVEVTCFSYFRPIPLAYPS
ncbi:hypothetical protein BU17DRAFT_48556 [Hysterangium stoloniferum]|nr:hypothetical protein BU17DRAFT_48556 [Hysterangium stoloniferum]